MTKLKLTALFLALLVLLGSFVGCNAGDVNEDKGNQESELNSNEENVEETEMKEKKTVSFRIATANIGDFTGNRTPGASPETVRETLEGMYANVIATQEDVDKIGGADVKETLYADYEYNARFGTGNYNYKAYVSDYELKNVKQVYYVVPAENRHNITHPWFLFATIELEGVEINLINIHVEWWDIATRRAQFQFILDYIEDNNLEYCIVIGDYNPSNRIDGVTQSGRYDYMADIEMFTSKGFTAANAGAFGVFDTILDDNSVDCPCDNIIVSGNMTITGVDRYAEPWQNDHAFLAADIEISIEE